MTAVKIQRCVVRIHLLKKQNVVFLHFAKPFTFSTGYAFLTNEGLGFYRKQYI